MDAIEQDPESNKLQACRRPLGCTIDAESITYFTGTSNKKEKLHFPGKKEKSVISQAGESQAKSLKRKSFSRRPKALTGA